MPKPFIAVFCGSSNPAAVPFTEFTKQIGTAIVKAEHGLVFGGTPSGLMKVVADRVFELEGNVIGVGLPKGIMHPKLKPGKIFSMKSLEQRKELMIGVSAGFFFLPGGVGTMDELFEVIRYNQSPHQPKPGVIFNLNGYYDGLIQQLKRCCLEKQLDLEVLSYIKVTTDIDTAMQHVLDFKLVETWQEISQPDYAMIATEISEQVDRAGTAVNKVQFKNKLLEHLQQLHYSLNVNERELKALALKSCALEPYSGANSSMFKHQFHLQIDTAALTLLCCKRISLSPPNRTVA